LDIGGYIGDTARYFLKRGAHKVIIYEPVAKNVRCLAANLASYQKNVEIIPKGIGEQDGIVTFRSHVPPGHIGFGFAEGDYILSFEVESFTTLLNRVHADIIKVDCEGHEKHLLTLDPSWLRKIPYWMIEIHSGQLKEQLSRLFSQAGFEEKPASHSVYHFTHSP
jgi:FkbM family methyltransferase